MKTPVKTLIALGCCLLSALTSDTMARNESGHGGGFHGGSVSRAAPSRSFSRAAPSRSFSRAAPSRLFSRAAPSRSFGRSPGGVSNNNAFAFSGRSAVRSVPSFGGNSMIRSNPVSGGNALRSFGPRTSAVQPRVGNFAANRSFQNGGLPTGMTRAQRGDALTLPNGVTRGRSGALSTFGANPSRSGNLSGLANRSAITNGSGLTNQFGLANRRAGNLTGQTAGLYRGSVTSFPVNTLSRSLERGQGARTWWNGGNAIRSTDGTFGRNALARNINNNFQRSVNWSTNRHNWGYNPWWSRHAVRPWYGGCWNFGWSDDYYDRLCWLGLSPWPGYGIDVDFGWGLCGWGLGNLLYDCGYLNYYNPYYAGPVYLDGGGQVSYTEPITSVAANSTATANDVSKMTAESELWVNQSQAAFKERDYLNALTLADKAVAAAPGDGALHEYRALVLFALGKYAEASGVLNPVLAGGPGWDWNTMIALYDSQRTYETQLQSLESYAKAKPREADLHFLLGYHYMVGGRTALANAEFTDAAKLQPADGVSAQLRDLTAASINGGGDKSASAEAQPAAGRPPPAPVTLQQIEGKWVADKGNRGTVTLDLNNDGKFDWTYDNNGKTNEFAGDYRINQKGLLVLDGKKSQMVATVEMPRDDQMKFVLAGGPPGDSGLTFNRK